MKTQFIFLMMSLMLSFSYAQVAYYPMTPTLGANDATFNANHGTVMPNASPAPDRFGAASEAYKFDGTGDYIALTNNNNFHPGFPLTVMAWVKIDANHISGINNIFRNCHVFGQYHGVIMNVASGHLNVSYGNGGNANQFSRRTKTGVTELKADVWYHVAGVINSANDIELYVNGRIDCGTYSGSANAMSYTNAGGDIGRGTASNASNFMHGCIDEVRLYNKALTDFEIYKIVNPNYNLFSIAPCGQPLILDAGYGADCLADITWSPAGPDLTVLNNGLQAQVTPPSLKTYTLTTNLTTGCPHEVVFHVEPEEDCCNNLNIQAGYTWAYSGWPTITFTNTSTSSIPNGITHLIWDFGPGSAPLIQTPPFTPITHLFPFGNGAPSDYYEVCVTAVNQDFDCEDIYCETMYPYAQRIAEVPNIDWNFLPNPATDKIQIQFSQALETSTTIRFYDMNGRVVKESSLGLVSNQKISVADLPNGIYLIEVEGFTQKQKLQILR